MAGVYQKEEIMTPFKERMNLYRAYREQNPDKNYWDWKASLEVPAMSTGGRNEEYVAQTDAIPSNNKYRQDAERELNLEEAVWLANHTDNNTGVVSPYYNSVEDTYSGGEGYEEGVPLDKLMGELVIRPEYKSAAEYERTMNRLGGAKGREYFHNAMHELDIPGKIVSVAEWAPGVGDVLDLTSAGIAAAQGDYQTAGMMAGMMFLPEFVAKPLSIAKRNSRKFFRRYSNEPNLHAHVSYMNGLDFAVAEQLRREGISETVIVPDFTNDALRRIITPRYAQYVTQMHDRIIPTSQLFELYERVHKLPHDDRMQLYKIIDEDPAYSKFLYDHPDLDPLSQETVDAFLKRQSTSLRGVSFPVETSDDLVNIALSHTSNERHGGDRLYTNDSGLYTSNSGEIGDRFSRPRGDVAKTRSDIGRLRYDFKINKQLPVREQLAQARRQIFNVDFADDMIDLNVEHLAKHGYVAKESMYTNRFGQKLPAYERAYFPTERTPLNTPAVQIEDVSTRIGLNDAKGRWGNGGVSSHEIDDELFVGANVGNSLGDYIKLMKTLKSSTHAERNPQYNLHWRSLMDVSRDTRMARFEQYDNLYRKFRNSTPYKIYDFHRFLVDAKPGYNKTAAEQLVGYGKVGLGLGASAILGKAILGQLNSSDNEFAKSNLFQQIYNNPAFYNNSLVNDDYLLFRRLKHTWNTNNAATLDDFLKEYPQYKKALSNDAVVPAMQYGGENKLLPDPARPYVDEYGIVHRNRYANGTPYEQGLELDPVADVFNPMNDVYDVVQIGKDATEGNWAGVGTGLVIAAMPKWMEKAGGAVKSGVKKLINKARNSDKVDWDEVVSGLAVPVKKDPTGVDAKPISDEIKVDDAHVAGLSGETAPRYVDYGNLEYRDHIGYTRPQWLKDVQEFYNTDVAAREANIATKLGMVYDRPYDRSGMTLYSAHPTNVRQYLDDVDFAGYVHNDGIVIAKNSKFSPFQVMAHESGHIDQIDAYNSGVNYLGVWHDNEIDPIIPLTRSQFVADNGHPILTTEYIPEVKNVLDDAYQFTEEYLEKHPGIARSLEAGSTNRENRADLWLAASKPSPAELNNIIDNMTDDDVLYLLSQGNGYSRDFYRSIKQRVENGANLHELVGKVKYAMKYIPAFAAPMALAVSQMTNETKDKSN